MEEIDIKQLIRVVGKKKKICIVIIALSIIIGMVYTFFIVKPQYTSNSKVLISSNDASIKEFIKVNKIFEECAEKINDNKVTAQYVKNNLISSYDSTTKIINISVVTDNSELSNNIIKTYSDVVREKLEETYAIKSYTVIEEPISNSNASNINHPRDLMIFTILGVVLAGIYLVVSYNSNGAIKNVQTIENETNVRVFGEILQERKNEKVIDYFVHEKKNINTLNKIAVTALISGDNGKSKSILITGTERDVGTTYITTNLAMSYAKIGNKVLVIDSNYKNGIQNKIFNINSRFGLSELIYIVNENNNEYINFKDYIQKSPIDGINVISYGEHQINEKLLISDKTIKLFKLLENEYDIILIDASPISKDMVSLILSNFTDSTIVVAQQNKTKMEDIKESKQTLKNINKNIAGVILNRVEE